MRAECVIHRISVLINVFDIRIYPVGWRLKWLRWSAKAVTIIFATFGQSGSWGSNWRSCNRQCSTSIRWGRFSSCPKAGSNPRRSKTSPDGVSAFRTFSKLFWQRIPENDLRRKSYSPTMHSSKLVSIGECFGNLSTLMDSYNKRLNSIMDGFSRAVGSGWHQWETLFLLFRSSNPTTVGAGA